MSRSGRTCARTIGSGDIERYSFGECNIYLRPAFEAYGAQSNTMPESEPSGSIKAVHPSPRYLHLLNRLWVPRPCPCWFQRAVLGAGQRGAVHQVDELHNSGLMSSLSDCLGFFKLRFGRLASPPQLALAATTTQTTVRTWTAAAPNTRAPSAETSSTEWSGFQAQTHRI